MGIHMEDKVTRESDLSVGIHGSLAPRLCAADPITHTRCHYLPGDPGPYWVTLK